jgi:hypothetical protein
MRNSAGHIAQVRTSGVHRWFAAFFAFGATMCALTVCLLLFPGSALDSLWRLNPDARLAFASLGHWSLVLMLTVGSVFVRSDWTMAGQTVGHVAGLDDPFDQHAR